jgi:hypothetical protein
VPVSLAGAAGVAVLFVTEESVEPRLSCKIAARCWLDVSVGQWERSSRRLSRLGRQVCRKIKYYVGILRAKCTRGQEEKKGLRGFFANISRPDAGGLLRRGHHVTGCCMLLVTQLNSSWRASIGPPQTDKLLLHQSSRNTRRWELYAQNIRTNGIRRVRKTSEDVPVHYWYPQVVSSQTALTSHTKS